MKCLSFFFGNLVGYRIKHPVVVVSLYVFIILVSKSEADWTIVGIEFIPVFLKVFMIEVRYERQSEFCFGLKNILTFGVRFIFFSSSDT